MTNTKVDLKQSANAPENQPSLRRALLLTQDQHTMYLHALEAYSRQLQDTRREVQNSWSADVLTKRLEAVRFEQHRLMNL